MAENPATCFGSYNPRSRECIHCNIQRPCQSSKLSHYDGMAAEALEAFEDSLPDDFIWVVQVPKWMMEDIAWEFSRGELSPTPGAAAPMPVVSDPNQNLA